jgi:MscS family membrane protein
MLQDLEKYIKSHQFLGNPLEHCLWFVGIILAGFLLKNIVSSLLSKAIYPYVRHDDISVAQFVALLRKPIGALFMLLVIDWACEHVSFPREWHMVSPRRFGLRMILNRGYDTLLILATTWLLHRLIKFFGLVFKKKAEGTPSKLDDQLVPFVRDLAIGLVYLSAIFVILGKIFSVNIPALITGLGIGGLAIALAARETLENLFASFTILLDLPFVVGDYVQLGNIAGDVEHLGFRSTRLRTSEGELIVVPNRLLTSQALENQTTRSYRRAKYFLRVRLDTPSDKIQALIQDLKDHIAQHPKTSFMEDHIAFDGIAEDALRLMVIYYVQTPDLWLFNEVKAEIDFQVLKLIEKHQVQLALPSQTLTLER